MWRPEPEPRCLLPDLAGLVQALSRQADLFDPGRPLWVGRAPGRLDLMGGIADYSGSLVLQWPLNLATYVAVQVAQEPTVTIRSLSIDAVAGQRQVAFPLAALAPAQGPSSCAAARALLTSDPRRSWAAYVAGALVVLQRECGARFGRGLRMLVHSAVPPGKGIASSAALEVAAMTALSAAAGVRLGARQAALLCQTVENLIVGAPCGVMDQMTAACARPGRLLALLCQPAEPQGSLCIPRGLALWGIDSGVRHAVSGADYASVRSGAFMGYRIIAELAGLSVRPCGGGRVEVADPHWGGYLANITPSCWEQRFAAHVPQRLSGREFLRRYGGFTDSATRVDAGRTYAVRVPTAHPIHEHHRVRLYAALLEGACRAPGRRRSAGGAEEAARLLGELMYQSHASYGACGLGCEAADRLVAAVRNAGPEAGLYGAKITGGGSGGTVAVLGRREAEPLVRRLLRQYQQETGRRVELFAGSSPGAFACGALRMTAA